MASIDIFLMVLTIGIFSFLGLAIVFLKRILEQINAVRKDIHNLVENTIPVMNNLEEITNRVNNIVTDMEGYWGEIDNLIKNVREKISIVSALKDFSAVGYPVKYLVKNVKVLALGTSAFWRAYKNK